MARVKTAINFDPAKGKRTIYAPKPRIQVILRAALLAAGLGLGMTVAAAGPAYAESLIVSSKSVSAPLGFQGVCARLSWACARTSRATVRDADAQIALADRVNRAVNASVREIADDRQYGTSEYWALPTRKGGDCEDFALLKKHELMRAGISAKRLLIATVLDRRQQPHAVLVLRTGKGDYVLDNLTSRLKPWSRTGYSFLRMQDPSAPSGWTLVMRGGIFG